MKLKLMIRYALKSVLRQAWSLPRLEMPPFHQTTTYASSLLFQTRQHEPSPTAIRTTGIASTATGQQGLCPGYGRILGIPKEGATAGPAFQTSDHADGWHGQQTTGCTKAPP